MSPNAMWTDLRMFEETDAKIKGYKKNCIKLN